MTSGRARSGWSGETGEPTAQVVRNLGISDDTLGNSVNGDKRRRGEGHDALDKDEWAELRVPPRCLTTTVWAALSATVAIPSILVPAAVLFGISTARTGGEKYVPSDDLMKFAQAGMPSAARASRRPRTGRTARTHLIPHH